MYNVSVVMPVYNGWDLMKRNIESLMQFETGNVIEIIAVDDCSPQPNPYEFNNPLLKIIRNERNLGYTGTVNNGLRNAKSEIILLLDSDAFLIKPIVKSLTAMYESDPGIGCIGFAAVSESGKETGSFQYEPTLIGLLIGQQMEAKLKHFLVKKNTNILPLSCCVSFRKQCLEDVDYFDADNFPVLEADNDLSMRIHASKWKLLYEKNIVVCHEGGNSYKVNSKRVRMYHEAKWRLFKKHRKIPNEGLAKLLLGFRIRLEIGTLRLLKVIKKNESLNEKLAGRIQLLNDIKRYS